MVAHSRQFGSLRGGPLVAWPGSNSAVCFRCHVGVPLPAHPPNSALHHRSLPAQQLFVGGSLVGRVRLRLREKVPETFFSPTLLSRRRALLKKVPDTFSRDTFSRPRSMFYAIPLSLAPSHDVAKSLIMRPLPDVGRSSRNKDPTRWLLDLALSAAA